MESKVCLFSARPWDEANMLENLVRVHLLAKEKYQMVRIGAAEGPKIWCVGWGHSGECTCHGPSAVLNNQSGKLQKHILNSSAMNSSLKTDLKKMECLVIGIP